jgi:hypothetical protein
MDDANIYRHTRIDKQTNKLYTVVLSFDSFHYVITKSDRHSFAVVPETVHYAEHIPLYTNEMATCRNLRFRIKSRTQRR